MPSKVTAIIKNKYFLSLSGNVIMSGLGMLTMAIIYRSLPISEAGVWVYFSATVVFIDTFRSGLLTTAFIKFYAGSSPERMAEIAGSAWFIGMCITGILVLVNIPFLFFINQIHDQDYVLLIKWFSPCFICMLPWFITTCVIQGEQRFDRLLYVRLVNQGGFTIYMVLLLLFKRMNLEWVIISYVFSHLITSIFALSSGWSRINTFGKRTKKGIKDLFDFGKFSVGTTLSANMFGFSDTQIIKMLLGDKALAIYNLGQTLMQAVEIILRSFAATAMPSLSKAFNLGDKDSVIYVMKKYVGMLTLLLIPIAVLGWLLANIPIYIIAGHTPSSAIAANVFRLFLTFALLYPADRFFALTLDVIHKPKVNFYKVLVMLATNITFDILGIKIFGNIYGIAITTVMPILVGVIIGYWALNKWHKFSFWNVYTVGWNESKTVLTAVRQKFRPKKAAGEG